MALQSGSLSFCLDQAVITSSSFSLCLHTGTHSLWGAAYNVCTHYLQSFSSVSKMPHPTPICLFTQEALTHPSSPPCLTRHLLSEASLSLPQRPKHSSSLACTLCSSPLYFELNSFSAAMILQICNCLSPEPEPLGDRDFISSPLYLLHLTLIR